MEQLGVERKLSTAYHPQTNGQTERMNRTLETYLRSYVNEEQNNWVELLPNAQFAYNSAVQETTGMTPFKANYGCEPVAYWTQRPSEHNSQHAIIEAEKMKKLHQELRGRLIVANKTMEKVANTKRSIEPSLK